jgi:ribose-phosphate pyrophosphokinase
MLLSLPADRPLAERLADSVDEIADVAGHTFPDGETCLRLVGEPIARSVVVVASLRDPDRRALPLLLLADAARQWGAKRVGLVAPYLPYMRQDAELHPGDAITARSFARILSNNFDWLVTVDPHLHRIRRLAEIYTIPARVIHSAPDVGRWIASNVESPVVVGPDAESRQWAEDIAAAAKCPFVVMEKTRRGDADVSVVSPALDAYSHRVPVLVDDIISTGTTMAATVRLLRERGFPAPICVAVHALFAAGAYESLMDAGARVVATTNTVQHFTNQIDIIPALGAVVQRQHRRSVSR